MSDRRGRGPCPHLGLREDPDSRFSFPAPANCCYKAQPPAAVKIDHQEKYCLGDQYQACPIYGQKGKVELPKGGRWLKIRPGERLASERRVVSKLIVPGVAFILIAAFLLLSWPAPAAPSVGGSRGGGAFPPTAEGLDTETFLLRSAAEETGTVTPTATDTPVAASATAQATATPSPTMTETPTVTSTVSRPTNTATATSTKSVETCPPPAGWVPLIVSRGDTLRGIALRYGSSVTELQEANCLSTTTVDAGQVIYVPYVPPAPSATATSPPPSNTPSPPEATAPPPPPPTQPPQPTETQPPPTSTPAPTATPPIP